MKRYYIVLAAAMLFLASTGFECASTEMATAKVAIKRKDFQKAEESLKREVAARPNNGEAWDLLGELYFDQERFAEMDQAYRKAEVATEPAITAENRSVIITRRIDAWVQKFNAARDFSDRAVIEDNRALYTEALHQLDTAAMLRPDYPDHLFMRASIYNSLGDKAMTDKMYREYIALVDSDVQKGLQMGLSLGLDQSGLQARAGKPDRISVSDSAGGFAFYASKNLYVYFVQGQKAGEHAVVEGWKFYAADDQMPPLVKSQLGITLRSTAYYVLGYDAYVAAESNPSKFDEALKYLGTVEQLDPERADVGGVVADIYVRTNRIDEAMKKLKEQISRDPKNPLPYIAAGNIYNEKKDFSRAIAEFRKVLDLGLQDYEKPVQTVLFNLGAVYKNWGAELQDSISAASKNKPTDAQIEVYRQPLRESVKYFERLKSAGGRSTDFVLLTELANLYDVLGQPDKLKRSVAELEAIQQIDDNATNPRYWRALSRLYAIMGDVKKSEMADKKASSFGG